MHFEMTAYGAQKVTLKNWNKDTTFLNLSLPRSCNSGRTGPGCESLLSLRTQIRLLVCDLLTLLSGPRKKRPLLKKSPVSL